MWFLETDRPAAPSKIQLVRATICGLEVCWNSVPTAEAYLLQLRKYESTPRGTEDGDLLSIFDFTINIFIIFINFLYSVNAFSLYPFYYIFFFRRKSCRYGKNECC